MSTDEKKQMKEDQHEVAMQVLVNRGLLAARTPGIHQLTIAAAFKTTKSYRMGLYNGTEDLPALQMRIQRVTKKAHIKLEAQRRLDEQLGIEARRVEAQSTAASSRRHRQRILAAAEREVKWREIVFKVADAELSASDARKELCRGTRKLRVTTTDIARQVRLIRRGNVDIEDYASIKERRGRRTKISEEVEAELVRAIKCLIQMGWPVSEFLVRTMSDYAYQCQEYGEENVEAYTYTASDVTNLGFGRNWMRRFRKKHNLKLKVLKARDPKRKNCVNVHALAGHFDDLEECVVKHQFATVNPEHDPHDPESERVIWDVRKLNRIFTMDETRLEIGCEKGGGHFKTIVMSEHKIDDVQLPTGGFSCSLAACRNLANEVLAPAFCTKSNFKYKSDICNPPRGTATVKATGELQPALWLQNEKGSFDSTNFMNFLTDHVAPTVENLSPENPALMIVDGVPSHLKACVLERAHQLGIIIFVLPPNCTHVLQAEDLVNFPKFKREFYSKKVEYFTRVSYWASVLKERAGKLSGTVNLDCPEQHLMSLIREPWEAAFKPEAVALGWAVQGIKPFTARPLWKLFPNWKSQIQSAPQAETPPSTDSDRASRIGSAIRSSVINGDLFEDTTFSTLPIDGRDETIDRVVPFIKYLERVQLDLASSAQEREPFIFDAEGARELAGYLELAKNTVQSVYLHEYRKRQRGRGASARGEMTWDEATAAVAAKQSRPKVPNATRAANDASRAEYVDTLRATLASGKGLPSRLTRADAISVLKHLRKSNSKIPAVANPGTYFNLESLQELLRQHWPLLYNAHMRAPATKRGPKPSVDSEDESRDDATTARSSDDESDYESDSEETEPEDDPSSDTDESSLSDAPTSTTNSRGNVVARAKIAVRNSAVPTRPGVLHALGDVTNTTSFAASPPPKTRQTKNHRARTTNQRSPDASLRPPKRKASVKPKELFPPPVSESPPPRGDETRGCSKCRGRGCKRCAAMRNNGYVMVGRTAKGYPSLKQLSRAPTSRKKILN